MSIDSYQTKFVTKKKMISKGADRIRKIRRQNTDKTVINKKEKKGNTHYTTLKTQTRVTQTLQVLRKSYYFYLVDE